MSALITRLQDVAGNAKTGLQNTTDKIIPPKQREEKLKQAHSFASRNPKLAVYQPLLRSRSPQVMLTVSQAFLAIQTILLGPPILLFLAFAISTLFVSITTCLLIALTSAFIYTFFAVGIALLFLIPTLFIASFTATCFFFWGLAIYVILQRFNEGEAPAKRGTRVGDTLHGLTGDRLAWLLDEDDKPVILGHEADLQISSGKTHQQGDVDTSLASHHKHANGSGEWEEKWANGTQSQRTDFPDQITSKT